MTVKIEPQPGPQTDFLTTSADICIYGGAAGGGKSFGLLIDDIYHIQNPQYRSVTFRRVSTQITSPGGLWEEAASLYPGLGAVPNLNRMEWIFPSGARVRYSHMQYEFDKLQYQGSQIAVIKFDELTHFTESMFFYMLSRNRSTSGIRPYVRATTNADAESWVAEFIRWWIDPNTGFPIPERAGKIRWMQRSDTGVIVWADKATDLEWTSIEIDGELIEQPPRSVCFIPAKLTDNRILLQKDPSYLAQLLALPLVDRARLLEGNWLIRENAGTFFKREWFEIVDAAPADAMRVRHWDFAATEASKPDKDPDWTAGALVSRADNGIWYIEDMRRDRITPAGVEDLVRQTAQLDGIRVPIGIEQEPGSSGKIVTDHFIREVLPEFEVRAERPTGKKMERAKPVSSQAEARNVKLVRGDWNAAFLAEAEMFPDGLHDDQIDGVSGAFAAINEPRGPMGYRVAVSGPRRVLTEYAPR